MGDGIEIGKSAPAFSLLNQDGTKRSLKDYKGKWLVLYFYPKDNTPGCTTEACQFTEGIEAFVGLDAAIVGVSPDAPESHRKFIADHGLKIELLSDPDHTVMEKYGAWGKKVLYGKESIGVIRSTALIDPNGKFAHLWPKVKADGHAEQVRAKMAELNK
jgi:peroxiredoxin Q/BCP